MRAPKAGVKTASPPVGGSALTAATATWLPLALKAPDQGSGPATRRPSPVIVSWGRLGSGEWSMRAAGDHGAGRGAQLVEVAVDPDDAAHPATH